MPFNKLRDFVSPRVQNLFGKDCKACLLNGSTVYQHITDVPSIIMACNPRIKHVIPGIMRAAEELDAIIAFELTATEGGVDGGYTGQTPQQFVATVVQYAESCKFTRPFVIHADHITIKNCSLDELNSARQLIATQLAAGYTSFALDASFNPLLDNIKIISELVQPLLAEGVGLEVEIGEVTPVGRESNLTTVEDVEVFLGGLADLNINPHLLAIDNGSKSGNYLDGQLVNIDLTRTGDIFTAARKFGVCGLVQHGITGTPLRIVGKLADYGIRKGNIGTLWQNVAHAGLPPELVDDMRDWARENKCDIKYATGLFYERINSIPTEDVKLIADLAYREAKEFITAFHARGSASRLADAISRAS